jgi:fatty acid photodecarboxylase
MTNAFVDAAADTGIARNPDFNNWNTPQDGVGRFQVTQRDGVRESPATAYLEPARRRKNLTVHTGVTVEKLHFSNLKRAEAVSYIDTATSVRYTVHAGREILLTAGVYASPQLLMLSGVGPATHLRDYGIPVVADAPNVGQNLQDHAAAMLSFTSHLPHQDKKKKLVYYTEQTGRSKRALANYLFRGKGPLTSPMCEGGGFVKTNPLYDSCDLQLRFLPFFSESDPYFALSDYTQGGNFSSNKSNRPAGFSLQSVCARPRSRGSVALTSPDIRDRIAISANWMSHPEDMATLVAGLHLSRKIAAQTPFDQYRGNEVYPGAEATTDADLEEYVRQSCHTANAMVGTCRMGDSATDSVVDHNLCVRGVSGLRVVDASVMPTLPGGQSGAPTMMIAERAADLIKASAAAAAASHH